VGAWPDGLFSVRAPFRDRYQLPTFGAGGFVGAAMAVGVPIVPVSIVGAELPLPSRWYIEFGAPIVARSDDPSAIFELTDLVRETIQSTLYRLLVQRRR